MIMKTDVKKATKDESGKILILVLVLLGLGALLLAPLLGLMGTGLIAGGVYERKAAELYAADAGVERAIWQITNDGGQTVDPMNVNGKDVEVEINMVACRKYRINSYATTPGVGTTRVLVDLWALAFLDNAITSKQDVKIQPNSYVYGTVQYGGTLDKKGTIDGQTVNEEFDAWPTWQELYSYYHSKYVQYVKALDPYPDSSIDVKDNPTIGPLYRNGSLAIKNTGPAATMQLQDTIYVNGDLHFEQPGASSAYTIDLNGKTIFVEGSIDFPPKFVSVTGSGSIIAVGNINFQPMMSSDPNHFVLVLSLKGNVNFQPTGDFTGFVMSVEETVDFKPNGNFTGSVAGDVNVELLPNITLTWQSILDADIDFPFLDYSVWRIRTWNII